MHNNIKPYINTETESNNETNKNISKQTQTENLKQHNAMTNTNRKKTTIQN